MKALYLVALVALVLSFALSSTACTPINRRNTKWMGLPGPTRSNSTSIYVRVYRTDKFNYNIDAVDSVVQTPSGSMTKSSHTSKTRTTPNGDDMTIYSLANTTSTNNDTQPSFSLLKKLRRGVFEIIFRAYFDEFPLEVDVEEDKLFWYSNSTDSFYLAKPNGTMIIVQNVTADNRDFNPTTSTWTIFSFSDMLRNTTGTNSTESSLIGARRAMTWDDSQIVVFPYGNSSGCNDGSAFFYYSTADLTPITETSENSQYFLDTSTKRLYSITPNNTLIVEDIARNASNPVILTKHYTNAQLSKIINRYSLGSWVGPLVAIATLWVAMTIFCAVCNRDKC